MELNTAQKCEAILQKMLERANKGEAVTLERDFGGNTLTIYLGEPTAVSHTHCGVPDGEWEVLVDNLYNSLHGGPGLSWHSDGQN